MEDLKFDFEFVEKTSGDTTINGCLVGIREGENTGAFFFLNDFKVVDDGLDCGVAFLTDDIKPSDEQLDFMVDKIFNFILEGMDDEDDPTG